MSIELGRLIKVCAAFEKLSGVTVFAISEENPFAIPDEKKTEDVESKSNEKTEENPFAQIEEKKDEEKKTGTESASSITNEEEIKALRPFNTSLPDSFWQKFIDMCSRLGCKPKELARMLKNESSFKPDAVAPRVDPVTHKVIKDKDGKIIPQAKGLNQFIKATALGRMVGMSEDVWKRYETLSAEEQLPYLEKFFTALNIRGLNSHQMHLKNFGGHNNPDKSMYAGKKWMDEHPEFFTHLTKEQKAEQEHQYSQNTGLDRNNDGRITPDEVA